MLREIDIQPTDRVAFIHIPKTAGITFRTVIHPFLTQLPWCPAIIPEHLVAIPYDELLKYRLFTGHFRYRLLKKIFPSGFISLTFLREPVSRTLSHYQYILRLETFGSPWGDTELPLVKKMTLDEFLRNEQLHLAVDIVNIQTGFWGGFESPRELLPDNDTDDVSSITEHLKALSIKINSEIAAVAERHPIGPEHLEVAKKRLEQASFFGITERFQDSLFLLCFIFGWPPILDELRLNHHPDIEAGPGSLDPETRKQIEEKVALDLELYRFGQELFAQRFSEMTRVLLERYGDGVTAEAGQLLSKTLLGDLLQKHYEARRNQRNQTLLKNIGHIYLYRPSAHAEGSFGWHTNEILPEDGYVMWSGPGKESGFDLPCPRGENLQVSFQILMVLAPDIIEKLTLTINRVPVTLQNMTDARGTFIFTGSVPSQAMSGPFLHLVFSVPRTIAPCDINPDNKDARPLGFLLRWIKLECLSPNPNPERIKKWTKLPTRNESVH